jgi:glycosyltransferase involved in cell wall biosynthesis
MTAVRPLSSSEETVGQTGLSIIVPTYNRAELLRTALESIQKLRVPSGWGAEILVINNNSTDHTPRVVQEVSQSSPISIRICDEEQQGLCHCRNRALVEARYEQLVYLDDDMVVDAGWLEGYLEAYRRLRPDLVVGPVEPWFEESPGPEFTQSMLNSVTSAYSRKGDKMLLLPPEQGHEVPGCNFAVSRRTAIEAGGFDTRIDRISDKMLGGGDWEFGEKLVLLGRQIVYAPNCRVHHFIGRNKTSRPAMQARWEGMGASNRALMKLRGREPTLPHKIRLFLRMIRFWLRCYRIGCTEGEAVAFQWDLRARELRGFLFKCPRSVAPRSWPPRELSFPNGEQV